MIPLEVSYPAFAAALDSLRPGWKLTQRGLVGSDGVQVVLSERHSVENDGHVDVEFSVAQPTGPRLTFIDCVSGFGPTPEARARFAARLWAQTTGAACLEFAHSRRGDFADHYSGSDPAGFTGWYAIAGAVIGFGHIESANALQGWWLSNSVLPALAHTLADELTAYLALTGSRSSLAVIASRRSEWMGNATRLRRAPSHPYRGRLSQRWPSCVRTSFSSTPSPKLRNSSAGAIKGRRARAHGVEEDRRHAGEAEHLRVACELEHQPGQLDIAPRFTTPVKPLDSSRAFAFALRAPLRQ